MSKERTEPRPKQSPKAANQRDDAVEVREERRKKRNRYLRYAVCAAFGATCGSFFRLFPTSALLLLLFVAYICVSAE